MNDFDLEAYLQRIGYSGPLQPTAAALEALHLAHATHIPFENIDVLLKRPVALDLRSLQSKLVAGGRGGYCFEQNLLLSAALRRLGYEVTPLAARVRHRGDADLPRTHMLLLVSTDGERFVADVGFGGEGLLKPVPFSEGRQVRHYAWTYRVVGEGAGQWLLQSLKADAWRNLYSFTLEPQTLADYEMAHHYMATHPRSPFVASLVVQLPTPQARYALRDREFTADRGDRIEQRTLRDEAEIRETLAATFGLRLPGSTPLGLRGDPPAL